MKKTACSMLEIVALTMFAFPDAAIAENTAYIYFTPRMATYGPNTTTIEDFQVWINDRILCGIEVSEPASWIISGIQFNQEYTAGKPIVGVIGQIEFSNGKTYWINNDGVIARQDKMITKLSDYRFGEIQGMAATLLDTGFCDR